MTTATIPTETALQAPRVNLNGTSKAELVTLNMNAALAVSEALQALQYATPNGRDYQTLGPDAFRLAQAQHRARWCYLRTIMRDLETLAEMIDSQ